MAIAIIGRLIVICESQDLQRQRNPVGAGIYTGAYCRALLGLQFIPRDGLYAGHALSDPQRLDMIFNGCSWRS
jgi:hypothetical protein